MTYFISDGTLVKIGISRNVKTRLKTLQIGHPRPLTLLGSLSGNYEKEFHQKYAAHRVRGEWFSLPDAFICWLLTQIERDDPIGDLANDARNDGRDGHSPLTLSDLRNRVLLHGCSAAQTALKSAVREWRIVREGTL